MATDEITGSGGKQVQSVMRALDLLFLVAQTERPLSIADIAAELSLPRSTVYRLAETLMEYGVVARKQDRLLATPRLFLLTSGNRSAVNLEDIILPHLTRLTELTRETTGLHVRRGQYRRCVVEVEGFHGIRWARGAGFTASLRTGAVGHVLLGALNDEEIDGILSESVLSPLATNSPTTPEDVRKSAETARTQGWSYSQNETVEGAAAIAAPVRGSHSVVACLSVYAPVSRGAALREYVADLLAIAHTASAEWTRLDSRSTADPPPASIRPLYGDGSANGGGH